MRALVFEVRNERYGISASRVVEVLRRPPTRAVASTPAWVAGMFARDSGWVPLLDLSMLLVGEDTPDCASSRVALVELDAPRGKRALGLLAPRMTRVLELGDATARGLHVAGHEFLGAIASTDERGVQLIDLEKIFPPELDTLLFGPRAADAAG